MAIVIPLAVACFGHLAFNQNVLIYSTHIKKVNAMLYAFGLRSEITDNI